MPGQYSEFPGCKPQFVPAGQDYWSLSRWHGTAVSGNGVAAANKAVASLAATKASVKGASAAATANDSKSLPQTGNENASAVVALGAVSAMFGLGLAAKKREF